MSSGHVCHTNEDKRETPTYHTQGCTKQVGSALHPWNVKEPVTVYQTRTRGLHAVSGSRFSSVLVLYQNGTVLLLFFVVRHRCGLLHRDLRRGQNVRTTTSRHVKRSTKKCLLDPAQLPAGAARAKRRLCRTRCERVRTLTRLATGSREEGRLLAGRHDSLGGGGRQISCGAGRSSPCLS